MMFSCVLAPFPCCFLGQLWYLIVSIPDLCLLSYFQVPFQKQCSGREGIQVCKKVGIIDIKCKDNIFVVFFNKKNDYSNESLINKLYTKTIRIESVTLKTTNKVTLRFEILRDLLTFRNI